MVVSIRGMACTFVIRMSLSDSCSTALILLLRSARLLLVWFRTLLSWYSELWLLYLPLLYSLYFCVINADSAGRQAQITPMAISAFLEMQSVWGRHQYIWVGHTRTC